MKLFLGLLSAIILFGGCTGNIDKAEIQQEEITDLSEDTEEYISQYPDEWECLQYVVVQFKDERPSHKKDEYDRSVCAILRDNEYDFSYYIRHGLLSDICSLLWILPRDGYYEDSKEIKVKESPILEESEDVDLKRDYYSIKDKDIDTTYIRLYFGSNDLLGYTDILMCIDKDNPEDALLYMNKKIRSKEDEFLFYEKPFYQKDIWQIVRLSDYGGWLQCEIDMFLRALCI